MNPPTITNLPFPDLDLIYVEGGKFMMGDEVGDLSESCRPVHPVKVSSFYMAKFPVTQRLYQAVMGSNPSHFKGDLRPVETITWNDAQTFIEKLINETGKEFRLPTEAEWEYAARGGAYSQGYIFAGSDKLKQVGWYSENANGETHDVGLLLANELGIHDLSGNIAEWCCDFHDKEFYEKCYEVGTIENPVCENEPNYPTYRGALRVLRGGSYLEEEFECSIVKRSGTWPNNSNGYNNIGLRLVIQT